MPGWVAAVIIWWQLARALRESKQVKITSAGKQVVGAIPGGPGFAFRGPRIVVTPPLLDQYYVEFLSGKKRRPIVIGDGNLRPTLTAHTSWLHARQYNATMLSDNGRAQLRLLSVSEGGGTLIVTTSLATVNKTIGRLELILIISSCGVVLLVGLGGALVLRREAQRLAASPAR